MSGKLQTVHVRVNDAATGKPTPCRVRFTDGDATYYAPHGRLTRFAAGPNQAVGGNVYLGLKPYAYIDGTCEINLPPGPLQVEIAKGPEYQPLQAAVQVAPGKLALRFTIERWSDLRTQGWYSGDTRALFLSPHAALLEGQAEDLAVVNLLAAPTRLQDAFGAEMHAVTNLLGFSGQDFALSVPGHGVAVNTLNRHPVLGTLALLNCHRVVHPLTFGRLDGNDDWTLADWCDQCHRKRGLVVWVDACQQSLDYGYGEALADLIVGKVDAFELDHFEDSPFDGVSDWTTLLNAGLKATLVGASGKTSNGRALGVMRTYAHLPPGAPLTYGGWIEAVRAGRTFVTNGPLLSLSVNGAEPATTALHVAAHATVAIHAEARSWLPFDRLDVCFNGDCLQSANASSGPPFHATLDFTCSLGQAGWLMARCVGAAAIADRPANQRLFACTSPVYIEAEPRGDWPRADAVRRLRADLDTGLEWVHKQARCTTDHDRQRLADVFLAAQQGLQRKVSG